MAALTSLRIRIDPWDEQAFVRVVENARDQVHAEGLTINGPEAAARAEALIHAAGYPLATVVCDRTAEEAMAHGARWVVHRDGRPGLSTSQPPT
jgi:hypothetical protein